MIIFFITTLILDFQLNELLIIIIDFFNFFVLYNDTKKIIRLTL